MPNTVIIQEWTDEKGLLHLIEIPLMTYLTEHDLEPVVRCKDCRYFHKYGFKLEYTECTHFDCDIAEDGFCAWGERDG